MARTKALSQVLLGVRDDQCLIRNGVFEHVMGAGDPHKLPSFPLQTSDDVAAVGEQIRGSASGKSTSFSSPASWQQVSRQERRLVPYPGPCRWSRSVFAG